MPTPPDPNEEVTISRGQLAVLQRAHGLLDKLYSGKDTATAFKRLAKTADPEGKLIKVPDLELAEEFSEPINKKLAAIEEDNKKLREEIAAEKKAAKDDADLRSIHAKIDDVVKRRGLTEDGRKGLIETMQKRQIADPDAAALIYLESIPKPAPTQPSPVLPQRLGRWNDGERDPFQGSDEDTVKKWFQHPEDMMDQEITKILNEAQAA